MTQKTVPVIDIEPLVAGAAADNIAERIGDACREWGFFQITNAGISADLVARVWEQAELFFALPQSVKDAVTRGKQNPRGYYNRELTKNTRDMKEVFDFGHKIEAGLPDDHPANLTQDGFNQWPDPASCPLFEDTLLEYYHACAGVGLKLLEAVALSLGLPADHLERHFVGGHTSFLRLNYYPKHDPLPAEDGTRRMAASTGHMGVHHHSDAGVLTLLLQDEVGGLQVCRDSQWFPVEPLAGALVVNIGDIVQVWSNDLYNAPLHRVVASTNRDRYSVPYFFNPSYGTDYCPLETLTSRESPPRYANINWGEFRRQRQLGDYADFGKEIQIADFRL